MTSAGILVVGGSGFVGSNVVCALVAAGERVVVLDNFIGENRTPATDTVHISCDACDLTAVRSALHAHGISTVINVATKSLPYCLKFPYEGVAQTVGVTQVLCEAQRMGEFDRLIHCSSSEVYGAASSFPIHEDHPLNPVTPYAAAKAACDHIVLSYVRTFGTRAHILRPFNQFGPYEKRGELAALISRVIDAVSAGKKICVSGDGEQTRDFLYVENTLPAILSLLRMPHIANGDVIQIASGEERSVISVIETVFCVMGKRTAVHHSPERPGDIRRQCASAAKAKNVLSWEPSVSFEEGIERTVRWHRENPV